MKALVMLPGWGTTTGAFDALSENLAARFAVTRLELPGYGDGVKPESHSLAELAVTLAREAPPRCIVVGWSLGAQIALQWAHSRPEQVERVVAIAATPCFLQREGWPCAMAPDVFDTFSAALESDRRGTLERFALLQAQGDEAAKHVARGLRAALCTTGVDVLAKSLRVLRDSDLRPRLAEIRAPALVVHGERDRLVPVAAAESLARALPHAKLAVIRGAAHAPFVAHAAAVAAAIEAFGDG